MHWVISPFNQSINASNFLGEKRRRRFNKCKRRKQSHTFCSIYEAAVLCVRRVWSIKSLNSELPPWTLCWIIHLFVEDVFDWGAEPEQTTQSSRRPGAARWDPCFLGFRFSFLRGTWKKNNPTNWVLFLSVTVMQQEFVGVFFFFKSGHSWFCVGMTWLKSRLWMALTFQIILERAWKLLFYFIFSGLRPLRLRLHITEKSKSCKQKKQTS